MTLKNKNIFSRLVDGLRTIRKNKVYNYLVKSVFSDTDRDNSVDKNSNKIKRNLFYYYQPRVWVIIKIIAIAVILIIVYGFHNTIAGWMENVFAFFRLEEIYNFEFPKSEFFIKISSALFLLAIGYYFIYFLSKQIRNFLSILIIDKNRNKIYFLKDHFIKRELSIISIPEIDIVTLDQNIISKALNIGTIHIKRDSSDEITADSISKVDSFLLELQQASEV